MPLIAKLFKEGDEQRGENSECDANGQRDIDEIEQNFLPENSIREFYDCAHFVGAPEQIIEEEDEDDDPDMLSRPRPKKLVPDLPKKSHLRASKILENFSLDLKDLNRTKIEDQESLYSNPHDSYLSSEEDGSTSGDDYEDVASEYEESSDKSTVARRHSYEETARAVSFQCMKPKLVKINQPHHSSPASYPVDQGRLSLHTSRSQTFLPPRTSSRPSLALHTSMASTSTTQHSFLSSDPYPTESHMPILTPTNLTPTSAHSRNNTPSPQKSEKSSSGWSGIRAVSRTLTLARKKASMPKINLAYTAGVVPKRNSISPTQIQGDGTSASTTSISSTENLVVSPRRRSQTFDRLMQIGSREGRPGSAYVVRPDSASEGWRFDSSQLPPVKSNMVSIPTTTPTQPSRLQQRNRSFTTSHSSSSSNSNSKSSSIYSQEPDIPIPSIPTTTSSSPIPPPTLEKEVEKEKEKLRQQRMTIAAPDYASRDIQVTSRHREDQRRDSGPPAATSPITPITPSTPGSNTYQDIMKSVTVEGRRGRGLEKEKEKEKERDREAERQKEKTMKGRGSMAMLAGVGAGFRRAASGKGVKA